MRIAEAAGHSGHAAQRRACSRGAGAARRRPLTPQARPTAVSGPQRSIRRAPATAAGRSRACRKAPTAHASLGRQDAPSTGLHRSEAAHARLNVQVGSEFPAEERRPWTHARDMLYTAWAARKPAAYRHRPRNATVPPGEHIASGFRAAGRGAGTLRTRCQIGPSRLTSPGARRKNARGRSLGTRGVRAAARADGQCEAGRRHHDAVCTPHTRAQVSLALQRRSGPRLPGRRRYRGLPISSAFSCAGSDWPAGVRGRDVPDADRSKDWLPAGGGRRGVHSPLLPARPSSFAPRMTTRRSRGPPAAVKLLPQPWGQGDLRRSSGFHRRQAVLSTRAAKTERLLSRRRRGSLGRRSRAGRPGCGETRCLRNGRQSHRQGKIAGFGRGRGAVEMGGIHFDTQRRQ